MLPQKNIYYGMDLNGNIVSDVALETVESLPEQASVGRMVIYQGQVFMYGESGWVQVSADVVTEWDDPTDSQVPSASLVSDSLTQLETALASKTDVTMAIPIWSESLTYKENSTVVYEGGIYLSTQDGNTGNLPTDKEWWTEVRGSGGGASGSAVYPQTIVSDTWNIVHNLGMMVAVQTYDSNGVHITGSVSQTSPYNSVSVSFNSPISGYAVVIGVEPSGGSGTGAYEQTVPSNVWAITHGLGRLVAVQTYDQNGNEIRGSVSQAMPELDTVTIMFESSVAGTALII